MDTELQSLKKPSSSSSSTSSPSSRQDQEVVALDDEHRYTSLKDIILSSPPISSSLALSYDHHHHVYDFEFDPSHITIRNQLVKHAASVYVQSAAILASRNQSWFVRLWEKVRNRVATSVYWCHCYYVCDPLRACFLPLYHSIEYMVGGALDRMMMIRI